MAQLLDYGSDLWQLLLEAFEATVAQRFFTSINCQNVRLRERTSLTEAIAPVWADLTGEEVEQVGAVLSEALDKGAFYCFIVAQRFTPLTLRTVEYLNTTMPKARFYAVELVRFGGEKLAAFESRRLLSRRPGIAIQVRDRR